MVERLLKDSIPEFRLVRCVQTGSLHVLCVFSYFDDFLQFL